MADSKRLAVLKNIQQTLQGMVGVGYHYPVEDPSQVTLDPTNILAGSLPAPLFYLIEPGPNSKREWYPAEQIVDNFEVIITGRNDAGSSDPLGKMTVAEGMIADLEVALEADMTRGGLVCDTRCSPADIFIGVGSQAVLVTVKVMMQIYRAYGQP